ncbi:MAG: amphi-Trp domain-containing protein [Candidatus Aenigmatarchaeota archaeon]
MKISNNKKEGKKTVEGDFNREFYMNRSDLSDFLRKLADEVEQGNELKISTDEWELPFTFREQVEVEIDKDRDELEIEIEFEKQKGGRGLSVGE